MGALAQLCGDSASWSLSRALALIAMWGAMCAAMLVPCALLRAGHASRAWRAHVALLVPVALTGGLGQWALESVGAMRGDVPAGGIAVQVALLLVGLAAAAVRLRSSANWASVAAMVSLQFAGGAMNLPWMLAVTACMAVLTVGEILLAELMLPDAISPIARPTA